MALASEYAGAAGSNHGLTSWDELWGYTSESATRFWEELTPVPTLKNSIRFITTYAGFENESELLWKLYKQGVGPEELPEGQGTRLDLDLPIYFNEGAKTFCYWDHEPRMRWQTAEYYAEQRGSLRPAQYQRLHENRWTTGTEVFITAELWDGCVNQELYPITPIADEGKAGPLLFVGVDLGIKNDFSSVVAVKLIRKEQQSLLLEQLKWLVPAHLELERPVTFPPGRARLATIPFSTAPPITAKTIGIVCVACFAALVARVPPVTITSTRA